MEKYVNKIKSALTSEIKIMLSKKPSIKLISGYTIVVDKIDTASIASFSELKLMDFIGGRKFEVDGEGTCSLWEKLGDGDVLKQVAFRFKKASVNFNDAKQEFDVLTIGEFIVLNFC